MFPASGWREVDRRFEGEGDEHREPVFGVGVGGGGLGVDDARHLAGRAEDGQAGLGEHLRIALVVSAAGRAVCLQVVEGSKIVIVFSVRCSLFDCCGRCYFLAFSIRWCFPFSMMFLSMLLGE